MPRSLIRWAAIVWTLGILVALSLPPEDIPGPSRLLALDKIAHAVLFGGFGLLWMLALRRPAAHRAAGVLLAGSLFAIFTEIYQGLLPYPRTPDPLDALADVAGLALAVGLAYLWLRRRQEGVDV